VIDHVGVDGGHTIREVLSALAPKSILRNLIALILTKMTKGAGLLLLSIIGISRYKSGLVRVLTEPVAGA
jgi:hypothetical protein